MTFPEVVIKRLTDLMDTAQSGNAWEQEAKAAMATAVALIEGQQAAALIAPPPSGSAGAMREALSEWVAQGYIDADGDHCGSAAYAPALYTKSIAALAAAAPQAQEGREAIMAAALRADFAASMEHCAKIADQVAVNAERRAAGHVAQSAAQEAAYNKMEGAQEVAHQIRTSVSRPNHRTPTASSPADSAPSRRHPE